MQRIVIRHAEPEDHEALYRIFSGPRVIAGTLQLPFPTRESWRERLAGISGEGFLLVACAGDELVGNVGLHVSPTRWRTRHAAELGMSVRDDWQGRGVGTALMEAVLDLADNWLNLMRIELRVYADNAAGIALYRKFGFEIEGTHRRFAFRDGEYVDAYSMARLLDRS